MTTVGQREECPHFDETDATCRPCGLTCNEGANHCFSTCRTTDIEFAIRHALKQKRREAIIIEMGGETYSQLILADFSRQYIYMAACGENTNNFSRPFGLKFADITAVWNADNSDVYYFSS